MHQPAQRGVFPAGSVNVENVRAVLKRLHGIQVHPLNAVKRFVFMKNVRFRNENGVSLRKLVKLLPGVQILYVHGTGMIPCAFCSRSGGVPLNLHIIFSLACVGSVGVQTDRTRTGQPPEILLRFQTGDYQIVNARQYPKNKLRQGDVIPKQAAHKIIVDGPKAPQPRQVVLPVPLLLRSFPLLLLSFPLALLPFLRRHPLRLRRVFSSFRVYYMLHS